MAVPTQSKLEADVLHHNNDESAFEYIYRRVNINEERLQQGML